MRPNLTKQSPNPNKPERSRGKILFINAIAEFYAGRAQNYLRPGHVEKIASTYELFEDVPGYARRVSLEEIKSEANDYNLNFRRYVDNSPPPEPHDVRAHLLGGVPKAEIDAQQQLFESLGSNPTSVFKPRHNDLKYYDFADAITDKSIIRSFIENDGGVKSRSQAMRDALTAWWGAHATHLANLPNRRDLITVRKEFLETLVAALEPLGSLDHFKLSGVIATWWTETLPDFKTLVENGFPDVIDGWIDAIADAIEDDEAAGPVLDPFTHKLVLRTMSDYMDQIATAKVDIARLKGEKEAFEKSNPPDDVEDEELEKWNYAKDLDRQIRELKTENKSLLKRLANVERAAAKGRATSEQNQASIDAKALAQPMLQQLAAIDAELEPYEKIKTALALARAKYRALSNAFVDELRRRCSALSDKGKQQIVLELFAQDAHGALDGAITEKRQELVSFIEGLWDKYDEPLTSVVMKRERISNSLNQQLEKLGYV